METRSIRAVSSFARHDERQFVFVIAVGDSFAIVENAELWEQPIEGEDSACYFYYPTVINGGRYATAAEAGAAVEAGFPWCRADGA